jgi:hypothetical protein
MPFVKRFSLPAAIAATLLWPTAGEAGPNVPLCLTLQNSYNACMVQAQRQQAWDAYRQQWDDDWDDGYDYYRQQRRQQRAVAQQAQCARWLYAIQQNGCVR